ncbi:MAG: hypothetical protein GXY83_42650 [Rhodopirellula sp.]|nr:hypothetical protein [Rhodopirellula sp.]
MSGLIALLAVLAVPVEPFDQWAPENHEATELPVCVGKRLAAESREALENGLPVTPYKGLTAAVQLDNGVVWAASHGGLMCLEPGADHWRLFHSRRWLPSDRVLDLAVARDGAVWAKTEAGICTLVKRRWTLEQKMAEIHGMLRKHHVRLEMICDIQLKQPGTLASGYQQHSSDNDGLWTSLYVAAEAFRYGATGDPQARRNAWQSVELLMLLEEVTGIAGFVARSIMPGDGPNPAEAYGGQWYHTPDGRWWWKGDTSSDEIDGHYFAYAVYYDVAATAEQKEKIRQVVTRITDHILDHGYYLVGPSGKPTTWGVWAPEQLNHNLRWIIERGLNSLEILSYLKVAEHITGNARYREAARELIEKHAYAMNTVRQKILWPDSEVNHSDDELAFLAYYPLLWLERDPKLREYYLWSIERSWQIERPERSPLFNLIYAAARQASVWSTPCKRPPAALVEDDQYDRNECLAWFREVPADTISWRMENSNRRDVGDLVVNRFGRGCGLRVLPISERLMLRWNADPYQLDNGDGGRTRGDGVFILLPYWMGRYHRLIE